MKLAAEDLAHNFKPNIVPQTIFNKDRDLPFLVIITGNPGTNQFFEYT